MNCASIIDLLSLDRFTNTGWSGVKAWDMVTVYNALPRNELDRLGGWEREREREIFT